MSELIPETILTVPKPARAERFRANVAAAYDLDSLGPADFEALDEIATAMTTLEAIRAALVEVPLVEIRQGGARVSPLVVEERLRAAALSAALARFPHLAEES